MNKNLKKIKEHLSRKFEEKSYKELSKSTNVEIPTSLIEDCITKEAFCFDDISDSFYDIHLSSADALLLKDNLYLIEFKPIGQKELDNNISKKMIESFHTLRERVFKDSKIDQIDFEIHFILVKDDNAVKKYSRTIKQKLKKRFSNSKPTPPPPDNDSFDKYMQRYIDKKDKRVYYDSVKTWTKSEFPYKITTLI